MAQKKSSKIGLKNVHVAEFDPETNMWAVPEHVPAIKEMSVTVNMTTGEEYAEDQLFDIFDSFDNFTIDLTFADLTPDEQAFFLGWSSIGAIKLSGANDNPPWVAIMGERMKSDGTTRLFKYFKGKARPVNESATTKGGQVNPQSDALQLVFGPLPIDFPVVAYAEKAKALVDSAADNYDDEALIWYDDVIPGRTTP